MTRLIRDARLYRDTHATFEDYLTERWDMSRAQAYRLIDAWPLAERLSPIGDKLNESQLRELLPLADRHGQDAAVTVYSTVAEAFTHEASKLLRVLHRVADRGTLQAALDADPDVVRKVIADMGALLDAIEHDVSV